MSELRGRLIHAGFPQINFIIINTRNSTDKYHRLTNVSGEIPVYQENLEDQTYETLGAEKDHILVIDKCNRLAYQVIMPWSILHYPYVKAAILSTYEDDPCGQCQDSTTKDEAQGSVLTAEEITKTRNETIEQLIRSYKDQTFQEIYVQATTTEKAAEGHHHNHTDAETKVEKAGESHNHTHTDTETAQTVEKGVESQNHTHADAGTAEATVEKVGDGANQTCTGAETAEATVEKALESQNHTHTDATKNETEHKDHQQENPDKEMQGDEPRAEELDELTSTPYRLDSSKYRFKNKMEFNSPALGEIVGIVQSNKDSEKPSLKKFNAENKKDDGKDPGKPEPNPLRIILKYPHYHTSGENLTSHDYLVLQTGNPGYHGHIDGNSLTRDSDKVLHDKTLWVTASEETSSLEKNPEEVPDKQTPPDVTEKPDSNESPEEKPTTTEDPSSSDAVDELTAHYSKILSWVSYAI